MVRKIFSLLFATFLFCVATYSPSHAEVPTRDPKVQTRLISNYEKVMRGQAFTLVFEQKIQSGWHTYWVNAGDSGSAPNFTWKKPGTVAIGEVSWPTPKRIPMEPLLNFGYEGTAHLLIPVTVSPDFKGNKFSIEADVEWLVCQEICIPEFAKFKLDIPISKNPVAANEETMALFAQAQSKMPVVDGNISSSFTEKKDKFGVSFCLPPEAAKALKEATEIHYFPREWGLLQYSATPEVKWKGGTLSLIYPRETRPLSEVKALSGVLAYSGNDTYAGFQTVSTELVAASQLQQYATLNLWRALLYAFLGGLILNLMPCVFPVLSLKALSFAKLAQHHETGKARLYALGYTAGVLVCFVALAGILIALKAAGAQIGWGFQLQEPIVIYVLALLLFAVGLNLSGFYDISFGVENVGHKLTQKEGVAGSFFTGLLATVVATPCTAPFMAGALGFALTQPAHINLLVFVLLGVGLAFPIFLLGFVPALQAVMPKPGIWMERFKQFLAFPIYFFTVWLVWVLAQQAGANAVGLLFIGAVKLAFILWLLKLKPGSVFAKVVKWTLVAASATVIIGIATCGLKTSGMVMPKADAQQQAEQQPERYPHIVFSRAELNRALGADQPIFIDMTAAWCISCKVNEKVALQTKKTTALFREKNIIFMIGDWTNRNPEITAYLQEFNRSGVPLYVYYPAPVNGIRPPFVILPQILTSGIVASYLE